MRRLLGLGDNTVDLYVTHNTMYPGGNTVNVAVLTARLGHTSSYLGVLGDDAAGQLILRALRDEGVNTERTRQVQGPTSWSRVIHDGTDRVFAGSDAGVSTQWQFTPDDDAFITQHQLVHTSIYSGLDSHLPRLRTLAPLLSYDFSSEWTEERLAHVAPHLDLAFLSAATLSDDQSAELAARVAQLGPRVVVLTRGEQGALAHADHQTHRVGIQPAEVVDTLGAGDAFITGFLNTWLDTRDTPHALNAGAREAARNCATYGAFGYGTPIPSTSATRQPC